MNATTFPDCQSSFSFRYNKDYECLALLKALSQMPKKDFVLAKYLMIPAHRVKSEVGSFFLMNLAIISSLVEFSQHEFLWLSTYLDDELNARFFH